VALRGAKEHDAGVTKVKVALRGRAARKWPSEGPSRGWAIDYLSYRIRVAKHKSHRKILTRERAYFRSQRERMRYSYFISLNLPKVAL